MTNRGCALMALALLLLPPTPATADIPEHTRPGVTVDVGARGGDGLYDVSIRWEIPPRETCLGVSWSQSPLPDGSEFLMDNGASEHYVCDPPEQSHAIRVVEGTWYVQVVTGYGPHHCDGTSVLSRGCPSRVVTVEVPGGGGGGDGDGGARSTTPSGAGMTASVFGEVFVTEPDGRERPLLDGAQAMFADGTTVTTGPDARLELVLPAGARLGLAGGSSFLFAATPQPGTDRGGDRASGCALIYGLIHLVETDPDFAARCAPLRLGENLLIVRGTEMIVSYHELDAGDDRLGVAVREGSVGLTTAAGEHVTVEAGEAAFVDGPGAALVEPLDREQWDEMAVLSEPDDGSAADTLATLVLSVLVPSALAYFVVRRLGRRQAAPAPTTPPDTAGNQFCTGCGAPRSPDASFCTSCGRPLRT